MKDATNLNQAIIARSVQQEVAWMTYPTGGRLYTVATMPEMVSPRRRGDLQAFPAASALGILSHIKNGADQERFIAKPPRYPKPLVTPCKNRLYVAFGSR